MKKCEKCGKMYPDNLYFCSDCGVALKDAASFADTNAKADLPNNTAAEEEKSANKAEKGYKRHGGLILGILGIIFGWWISGLAAFIMALCGFYLCKFEESRPLRWIALACCGIALFFGILVFLL